MLQIVPYTDSYADSFKKLNLEWITTYFYVEPKDVALLENAKASIIENGGYIFMGLWNNTPVACFSFIKITKGVYELGKMAVSKNYQGLKIGQKLLAFGIEHAKEQGWTKIVLYSSTKLDTALHIYKKHGFTEIPLEENVIYARSDIKMELILH